MNFLEEIIEKDLESGKVTQVITRFPPEPNGYLHIGHAKSICLNFGLAAKYNGECYLRFDDTNPEKEEEEYCRSIIEDVNWLGFEAETFFASDYFQIMYDSAVKLINKGKAYICELNADEIREYRGTLTQVGKDSPYRNRPISESLKMFENMRAGVYADGEVTLRAKIDMSSPNMNMLYPIIYMVLKAHHHRQGDKWCIYPMYDFAHPIEDAIEKITHSICTLEFEDHRPLYDWVIQECEFSPEPRQYEFARLNLTRTVMSKRFLKKLVDDGIVEGWDDPRMPTIAGLRRRGFPAQAIRVFCEKIGVSKANSEVDSGLLEYCVRDVLDPISNRVMVVIDPIKVTITNYESGKTEMLEQSNHPKDQSMGTRQISFSNQIYIERDDFSLNPPPKYHRLVAGGMVRLRGAYIIKCDEVITDDVGNVVELKCSYVPESRSGSDTSGIKVRGVIHWVDANNNLECTVNKIDYLLTEDDGTKKDFMERINPNSKVTFDHARAEKSLENAKALEPYQFMRQSYYSKDPKSPQGKVVFNEIVGLKDSYRPTNL